ncbi:MAG TPA: carboxypeptidase regulatory-like domain-containing protein [Gammaproteobacteria bacterium]
MECLHSALLRFVFVALLGVTLSGCNDDSSSTTATPTGKLTGTVTKAAATPTVAINEARVTIFNAKNDSLVAIVTTDATGKYSRSLTPGNYYIKVAAQGYNPAPPTLVEPVPFAIATDKTTTQDVEMLAATNPYTGWINGKVWVGDSGKKGVLVVASNGTAAFSALSGPDGTYTLFNVLPGDYSLTGYLAGYGMLFAVDNVTVTTGNAGTTGVDPNITDKIYLALTANAPLSKVNVSLSASGAITATPETMLVSLIHPLTRDPIPGLAQSLPYAPSISYQFSGVPDGTYLVRASYANDTIVVDPDTRVKYGEPQVIASLGYVYPDPVPVETTGAVTLNSPTNAMESAEPIPISATPAPTFKWSAYAGASDYVIEVTDATTGTVVWGGFRGSYDATLKNIVIPAAQTSIVFNKDYTATTPTLLSGHVYRWRIYASQDDVTAVTGWKLIGASEEQQGLFKVQ